MGYVEDPEENGRLARPNKFGYNGKAEITCHCRPKQVGTPHVGANGHLTVCFRRVTKATSRQLGRLYYSCRNDLNEEGSGCDVFTWIDQWPEATDFRPHIVSACSSTVGSSREAEDDATRIIQSSQDSKNHLPPASLPPASLRLAFKRLFNREFEDAVSREDALVEEKMLESMLLVHRARLRGMMPSSSKEVKDYEKELKEISKPDKQEEILRRILGSTDENPSSALRSPSVARLAPMTLSQPSLASAQPSLRKPSPRALLPIAIPSRAYVNQINSALRKRMENPVRYSRTVEEETEMFGEFDYVSDSD